MLDKQPRTSQPLGKAGSTLVANVHLVIVESASIKNIINACKLAGLKELNIVLQTLATAESLLLPEELEQGVLHIDFGAGPVKTSFYSNGVLRHYSRAWLSGFKLTEDLAVGLRISMTQAEQVKRLHGCCQETMLSSIDMVELAPYGKYGKRLIPRSVLAEIYGCRVEEMFTLVSEELQKNGLNGKLAAGAVITGGNALLHGIDDLAKQVLNMPVRIASSRAIDGVVDTVSLPHHSTAVGLVLLGARDNGVPQGIIVKGGISLLHRLVLAFRRVWSNFKGDAP